MNKKRVGIVGFAGGNLGSVRRWVTKGFTDVAVLDDARDFSSAEILVLPGSGSSKRMMALLRSRGADRALRDFLGGQKQLVGICLGAQVLYDWCFESNEEGLGVLKGFVSPVDSSYPPALWSSLQVEAESGEPPLRGRYFFNHNFTFQTDSSALESSSRIVRQSEHGYEALIQTEKVLAAQFHPEKSGASSDEFIDFLTTWAER